MVYEGDQKREYQRLWLKKRRDDFFADKCCVECGSTERLELDHIDPKLKVTHSIWSWSESRRLVEIAKCQVLCYSCHKAKSLAQMPETMGVTPFVHGTRSMYERHKCKCALCKHWKTQKNARTRANRAAMPR